MPVLADEHVPRVFVTTLRSNGFDVFEATEVVGEGAPDTRLLEYAGEQGFILVTHDKKDFTGRLSDTVEHAGIVVYTDTNYLRDRPEGAVQTFERILSFYPPDELSDRIVWLDEWRR